MGSRSPARFGSSTNPLASAKTFNRQPRKDREASQDVQIGLRTRVENRTARALRRENGTGHYLGANLMTLRWHGYNSSASLPRDVGRHEGRTATACWVWSSGNRGHSLRHPRSGPRVRGAGAGAPSHRDSEHSNSEGWCARSATPSVYGILSGRSLRHTRTTRTRSASRR